MDSDFGTKSSRFSWYLFRYGNKYRIVFNLSNLTSVICCEYLPDEEFPEGPQKSWHLKEDQTVKGQCNHTAVTQHIQREISWPSLKI